MRKAPTTQSRSEFAAALTQIAHEKQIEVAVILDAIEQAILAAFRKDYPQNYLETNVYEVVLDQNTGEARIFETEGEEFGEEEIKQVRAKKGAEKKDITPAAFGRIAAQAAKQVIYQKIREAERSVVVSEYERRIGTLVSGMVIRFVGQDMILDIGKTEAVMPASDQVHSENYHLNQKLTVVIKGIRDGIRGREVIVSRTDEQLIRELFKREVPEVNSAAVEIKAIARDPGVRVKMAVYSNQNGVDPVGSCVGQKGIRVQAVISELNGEKIDIVQYSEDPAKYVAAALSPAENLIVKIVEKTKTAQVSASPEQLPLAIGRDGYNAKLAGSLTGYHIDIVEDKTAAVPSDQLIDSNEKRTE